jgi:tetratricopeptide (TPR) repeat protein
MICPARKPFFAFSRTRYEQVTPETSMNSTTNPQVGEEAFSLYLQARSEWNQRTPAAIRKAIRYLEKAVTLNGKNLAEALTSAAMVRQMDLDWVSAEAEFNAAIRAHPGYAVARQRFGLFLAWMGRGEESRKEIQAAGTLDPHSPAIAASMAWVEYYQGRFPEAIRTAERAVSRHPGFSSAEVVLALSLIQTGKPGEAAAVLGDAFSREEENVSLLSLLSFARAREGNTEDAGALLDRLQDWASTRYVSPYYLAVPLQGLEREAETMRALEAAEAERSPQVVYLATEPIFDSWRGRPEFHELLHRLKLPSLRAEAAGTKTMEVA